MHDQDDDIDRKLYERALLYSSLFSFGIAMLILIFMAQVLFEAWTRCL